jgi:hypothetical protein
VSEVRAGSPPPTAVPEHRLQGRSPSAHRTVRVQAKRTLSSPGVAVTHRRRNDLVQQNPSVSPSSRRQMSSPPVDLSHGGIPHPSTVAVAVAHQTAPDAGQSTLPPQMAEDRRDKRKGILKHSSSPVSAHGSNEIFSPSEGSDGSHRTPLSARSDKQSIGSSSSSSFVSPDAALAAVDSLIERKLQKLAMKQQAALVGSKRAGLASSQNAAARAASSVASHTDSAMQTNVSSQAISAGVKTSSAPDLSAPRSDEASGTKPSVASSRTTSLGPLNDVPTDRVHQLSSNILDDVALASTVSTSALSGQSQNALSADAIHPASVQPAPAPNISSAPAEGSVARAVIAAQPNSASPVAMFASQPASVPLSPAPHSAPLDSSAHAAASVQRCSDAPATLLFAVDDDIDFGHGEEADLKKMAVHASVSTNAHDVEDKSVDAAYNFDLADEATSSAQLQLPPPKSYDALTTNNKSVALAPLTLRSSTGDSGVATIPVAAITPAQSHTHTVQSLSVPEVEAVTAAPEIVDNAPTDMPHAPPAAVSYSEQFGAASFDGSLAGGGDDTEQLSLGADGSSIDDYF